MAKSDITFKGKSMTVHDSYLEIMLHFMIPDLKNEIEKNVSNKDKHVWLTDFFEVAKLCEKGFFPGENAFDFDERIISEDFKHTMLGLLNSLKTKIAAKGCFIEVEELNQVGAVVTGVDHPYQKDVATHKILFIIDNMILMINEKELLVEK